MHWRSELHANTHGDNNAETFSLLLAWIAAFLLLSFGELSAMPSVDVRCPMVLLQMVHGSTSDWSADEHFRLHSKDYLLPRFSFALGSTWQQDLLGQAMLGMTLWH